MKKIFLLILALGLAACANQRKTSTVEGNVNTIDPVTIKIIKVKNGVAKIYLKNNSNTPLMYEHWFGLNGNPVAYCVKPTTESFVCSKSIVTYENGDYYTHEAVLQPAQSLTFIANVLGSNKVGVKFWLNQNYSKETFFWANL